MGGREFAGRYYWCIGLADSRRSEVYVHADRIAVDAAGLTAWVTVSEDGGVEQSRIAVAFAPGQWRFVYAASAVDGHAVDVEHWRRQMSELRP